MSQHTIGPWTINQGRRVTLQDSEGGEIATIAQGVDANPADATLIAAAPDLLEAIRECLRHLPNNSIANQMACNAIAKATGETK